MGFRDRLRQIVRGPAAPTRREPADASRLLASAAPSASMTAAGASPPAPLAHVVAGARQVDASAPGAALGAGPVHVVGPDLELAAAVAELYAARGEMASFEARA